MSFYSPDRRDLRDLREARASRSGRGSASAGRREPPSESPPAREGTLARAAQFRAWDGSQSLPNLEADEIMDALR